MVRKPDKLDSGGRLINVEFKHGKKMKKRRELDALVSNGKARRKTRSGHELLRNESESSEIEEFSSPDTKITVRNRRGGSFCGTCLTVLAFLLLLACIVACAGLMWVHLELKTELDTLKGRINSAESSNQGIPSELVNIKSQIQDWNKTLQVYRSGSHGLDEVIKNLTTLSQQVNRLQILLKEIKKKNNQAAEKPSDGNSLAKSVATIGSDVEALKSQHADLETSTKEKMKTLEDRVTHLEQQLNLMVVPPSQQPQASDSGDNSQSTALATQMKALQESLLSANTSIYGQISLIKQELSNHESRFATLESNFTKTHVSINTTAIMINLRDQLTAYVQSQMSNVSQSTGLSSEIVLTTIREEVNNISQAVNDLEQQISSDQVSDPASSDNAKLIRTLQVLRDQLNNTDVTVTNFNNSLAALEKTVDKLMHLYIQEKNIMVNVTSRVDGISRYLVRMTQYNPSDGGTDPSDGGTGDATTPVPDNAPTTDSSPKSTKVQTRRDASRDEVEKLFE